MPSEALRLLYDSGPVVTGTTHAGYTVEPEAARSARHARHHRQGRAGGREVDHLQLRAAYAKGGA